MDKGWIKAENLKEGENILLSSSKISIISKVSKQKLKEAIKVYNFEVSDWHTYFVSNIGVLVHNNCMLKPKGANKAVNNMAEFFKTEFGGTIKNGLNKTKQQFQDQSIYEVTKKLDNPYLKKGDKFYLDNLHKDHFEVFDKNGKLRAVLNLDGTLNAAKTEKAYGRILK